MLAFSMAQSPREIQVDDMVHFLPWKKMNMVNHLQQMPGIVVRTTWGLDVYKKKR
jgi:hypothetical protein